MSKSLLLNVFPKQRVSPTPEKKYDSVRPLHARVARDRYVPLIVGAVALAVRLLYLLRASALPTFLSPGMDAGLYRTWAESILAGSPPLGPFFRAPLYPYLIALFGRVPFLDTFWTIRLFQIIVSAAAAGTLAWIARRWYGRTAAWIAGLGWAFYGLSIYFDGEGLITSLFTSGFIFLILAVDRYRHNGSLKSLIGASLLLGLLTCLRANALAWWPVLLWVLLKRYGGRNKPRSYPVWTVPIISLAVLLVTSSPVFVHNLKMDGGWTISTQGGINFFLGNNPEATGAYAVDPDFGPTWTRGQVRHRAEEELQRPLNDAEVNRFYVRKALRFWSESPKDAAKLFARKVLLLLNAREIGNNRVLQPYLKAVSPLLVFLVMISFPLAAIFGIPFKIKSWKYVPDSRPAILFAITYAVTLLFFFINARYRFPIMPVLVLLAAGSSEAYIEWKRRLSPFRISALKPVAVRIILAAVVIFPNPLGKQGSPEPEWLFHRGNALKRLGQISEARGVYYRLLKIAPNYRNAHLNIGVTWLEESRADSAVVHFRREAELHPDNPDAMNDLGVIALRDDDLETAKTFFDKALELDPSHADASENLGHLLNELAIRAMEKGDFPLALERIRKAVNLDPPNETYNINLAVILAGLGERERAVEILYDVMRLHPKSTKAMETLRYFESVPGSSTP